MRQRIQKRGFQFLALPRSLGAAGQLGGPRALESDGRETRDRLQGRPGDAFAAERQAPQRQRSERHRKNRNRRGGIMRTGPALRRLAQSAVGDADVLRTRPMDLLRGSLEQRDGRKPKDARDLAGELPSHAALGVQEQ